MPRGHARGVSIGSANAMLHGSEHREVERSSRT